MPLPEKIKLGQYFQRPFDFLLCNNKNYGHEENTILGFRIILIFFNGKNPTQRNIF